MTIVEIKHLPFYFSSISNLTFLVYFLLITDYHKHGRIPLKIYLHRKYVFVIQGKYSCFCSTVSDYFESSNCPILMFFHFIRNCRYFVYINNQYTFTLYTTLPIA